MRLRIWIGAFAPGLAIFCLLSGLAPAEAAGPAVSAPNGKIEFDAGALSVPSSFAGRVAGTLTLPVGDAFGIQADVSAGTAGGLTSSAAFHVFTRDPESYLFGGTLGLISMPGAMVMAAGPEAELYFGKWTLEAWGGVSVVRPSSGPDRTAAFGMMDVAFYPQPNLRLSTGFSLLDNFAALHLGGEYQFNGSGMPLSLTGDARLGQDGSVLATVGLRWYFGAPSKPLILRHREDDPWDRGGSLFTAVGGATASGAGSSGGGHEPVVENPQPSGDSTQPPGNTTQPPTDTDQSTDGTTPSGADDNNDCPPQSRTADGCFDF